MNNSEQAKDYFQKYSNGTANSEEQAFVESWMLQYPLNSRADLDKAKKDADLAEVRVNLVNLFNPVVIYKRLWLRVVAAAAVVTIVFGIWFYPSTYRQENKIMGGLLIRSITPGKNTATLTLASGKTIQLSNVKTGVVIGDLSLKYSDGSVVESRGLALDRKTIMMNTPRGGTYQVILPDGSKVWLNAATSIKFPTVFSGLSARKVELLDGEAYFEVAKVMMKGQNARMPFVVLSKGQEVEVLGTHFNINSYTDEMAVKTTLLEGSVRVTPLGAQDPTAILKPNQQSILTDKTLKITAANISEAVAWKNGLFRFEGTDLYSLMRQISRWYNVKVEYRGEVSNDAFSGVIKRSANISEIIRILESGGLDVKVIGSPEKKIIISQ